jgi:eukaryotic-like serine/threonine-protein kinase
VSTQTLELSGLRVERILGRGGMALVYLALDEADRPVAVKLLADNLAADPEMRRRFLREAALAERVCHPNIVRVLGNGVAGGGRPYIILEYVSGPTLADKLGRQGRLPAEQVRCLGAQVAAGLAHAHAAGLVHRDVKPQNLLLTLDETVKITDFGIARVAEGTRLTQVGAILGTAAYLAPEQAAGEDATAAVDVYALGVVLYELLVGRTPYSGGTLPELLHAQQTQVPLPPRALAPQTPPTLNALVLDCLAHDPQRRPSAGELQRALSDPEPEAPTRVLPRQTEAPTRIERRSHRPRLWLSLSATVAALAIILGVALSLTQTDRPAQPPPQPRIAPAPLAKTPAKQARNLARWLRQHSR